MSSWQPGEWYPRETTIALYKAIAAIRNDESGSYESMGGRAVLAGGRAHRQQSRGSDERSTSIGDRAEAHSVRDREYHRNEDDGCKGYKGDRALRPHGQGGAALWRGVRDHRRNAGLGSRLIRGALSRARAAGHGAVVLVGDPDFYWRFGLRGSTDFGIANGRA